MKKLIIFFIIWLFCKTGIQAQCPDSLARINKIIEAVFIKNSDKDAINSIRRYFTDPKIDLDTTRGLLYVFTDTFTFNLLPGTGEIWYGGPKFDKFELCQKCRENKKNSARYARIYYENVCSDEPILGITTGEVYTYRDECNRYLWGGDAIYFNKDFTVRSVDGWAE